VKITNIKTQVKQAGRYSVFVDGKYSFSLSESALLDSKLFSGQEIDKSQLKQLKKASGDDKAYAQALRYTAMRSRSIWEIRSYLERKKLSDTVINNIINKLTASGLLNDLAFAKTWVENRSALKPSSARKIRLELRQKRVDGAIISDVLGDTKVYDNNSLKNVIERKRRQLKYQDDQKLMQYLARQGFRYDDIKMVLNEHK
jgi:regulatory protein